MLQSAYHFHRYGENGPGGPIFFEQECPWRTTYEKEKQLQDEIGSRVEHDLPGVEVLAVELANPDRFVVYVDHPDGVDHALCARVTDVLRDYLREYIDRRLLARDRAAAPQAGALRRASLGRKVALRTREPLDGRSKFKGELQDAGADAVTLGDRRRRPWTFRTRRSCGAT